LRVFIEKNAEERKKLAENVPASAKNGQIWGTQGSGLDQLAGVTHTDCEAFSRDFGTVLDAENRIPGGEYTLEVSSPGLDRKLRGIEDYRRFQGLLAKVQTFEPVSGNRYWQGRLTEVSDQAIWLELKGRKGSERKAKQSSGHGAKQGSGHKAQSTEEPSTASVEIALSNIEKAQLVPEI
jgi:ribosome maturation factor RimP